MTRSRRSVPLNRSTTPCARGVLLAVNSRFDVDAHREGDEVAVVFNGAGTRWPAELTKLSHPANGLYNSVRDVVQGASCGCAEVFGATEGVKACGVPIVKDHALAGTAGLLSLRRYVAEGWNTIVF